jgi:hypothetical protein
MNVSPGAWPANAAASIINGSGACELCADRPEVVGSGGGPCRQNSAGVDTDAALLQCEQLGEVKGQQLGFLQGRVDEAFFEPLPNDELECWG